MSIVDVAHDARFERPNLQICKYKEFLVFNPFSRNGASVSTMLTVQVSYRSEHPGTPSIVCLNITMSCSWRQQPMIAQQQKLYFSICRCCCLRSLTSYFCTNAITKQTVFAETQAIHRFYAAICSEPATLCAWIAYRALLLTAKSFYQ
ncbi:hypothetical protein VCUG_01294 [Vavraia culicis subsp. floridensis]|uniref:Uncharacterized protein n=1 Tax=Vavraia culicis (isolate floridensis) TaxID=948595 RepID=L2GU82_VAVCU|nr:uncharacterized protein VCUG_01294 [Vavraia culicis subsp. floridensis]ELA47194.1 hypothetical protein VCUG_01294 [Vavraia culicis subsp. floridensis]